jgi:alpha/beta superfamily hydrolase
MSDEIEAQLLTKLQNLENLGKMLPWLRVLVVIAFLFGGWIATLEIRAQSNNQNTQKHDFELENVDDSLHAHELRIQKLEGSQLTIVKTLDRIETKIDAQ